MKKIRYGIGICWAFLLGGLMACSNEEDPVGPTPDDGYRTLSIEIGAEGSLATKVYADDDNAYEHEFMNELCVFVVDASGTIEKKFLYSGETREGEFTGEPTSGNAYEWRSDDFELPTGNKTIYAFANWRGVDNTAWTAIINKNKGETLEDDDLSNISISDPAGNIDFTDNKYIPMSVKYGPFDFQVSQTARVELIRLVGRVDGTIMNNRASDITVSSVTMGPFAENVPLMLGSNYVTGTKEYTFNTPLKITSGNKGEFRFYVNETGNTDPFNIEVNLDDNTTMTGKLKFTATIPRNNFLPLSLNISDNDFELYVMAYINPIGGYPISLDADLPLDESAQTSGLYSATLPEGCSFQVFARAVSDGVATGGEDELCQLKLKVADEDSPVGIDDDATWAHVTSLSSQQETLTVTFSDNRSADISITTEPLKDLDDYNIQTTGLYLRSWCAAPRWYEPINLMIEQ